MQFIQSQRQTTWQYLLLIMLGLFVVVTACNNDDEPAPDPLSVTSINPTTAPVGSTITITGTSFNATPASNTVTFSGNVPAQVVSATPTQLVVTVPAGAQNGPITVATGGATAQSPSGTPFQLGAKPVVEVSGEIRESRTWTRNNVYVLRGFVYVTNNAVLTIEPGTIIKGATRDQDPSGQNFGGTLIVERGSRLEARGTAQAPIVFTSSRPAGQRNYGDWGGIVLIGRAPHNRPAAENFEGGFRGNAGAENVPNDNSGTLQYVRIEFPGIALSARANSEINGLTLYGVGSGTTIDHVQVSFSGDDAIEWFGGTVNAKYLVTHRTFDDDFDTDWGFTGKVQYAVALRDPEVADQSASNCFESDNFSGTGENPGGAPLTPNNGLPLTQPIFANISGFAFNGAPNTTNTPRGSGPYQSAMHLRRNTAISIYNSVFSGWPDGLRLDGSATGTLANAAAGRLDLQGIVIANTLVPVRGAAAITNDQATAFFNAQARRNQIVAAADLTSLLFNANNFNLTAPNFLPQAGSPLLQNAVTGGKLADPFFTATTFRGAFGTENWTAGWTNFNPQTTDYDR